MQIVGVADPIEASIRLGVIGVCRYCDQLLWASVMSYTDWEHLETGEIDCEGGAITPSQSDTNDS